jgi:crotonobetainyl-CoA:carnitine CoA-transferase CaiB-like acyl-CoA transferase
MKSEAGREVLAKLVAQADVWAAAYIRNPFSRD